MLRTHRRLRAVRCVRSTHPTKTGGIVPNYHRWRKPGGTYFFTVVTYNRRPILTMPRVRQALHNAWEQTRRELPFVTIAVVLLPDHLHCLWQLPEDDEDFSTRWRLIKARTTFSAGDTLGLDRRCSSRKNRSEGSLWQRRFWEHVVRDEADLKRHVDYIHFNPAKHGLAKRAGDWPYSSFQRFVAQGEYEQQWGEAEPDTLKGWTFRE